MPLEKSGIALPPYPYGLYGAKPKDVQGRTKTKADCKSGKYFYYIRRCQLDCFVLQSSINVANLKDQPKRLERSSGKL